MIRRLLLLNGLAALGVATYHAAAYGFSAMFEWTDRYRSVMVPNYDQIGSFSYYLLLAIRQLDAFVIPAFIFVSGFFVAITAAGSQSKKNWQVVTARIKTLLFPFILWTGLRYILLGRLPTSVSDVLMPYYFIVLVFQFYLLSPIIAPLAKTHWKLLILISAIVQMIVEGLFFIGALGVETPLLVQIKDLFPLWFFPRRIFWFVLGIVASTYRESLTMWLARVKWQLLTAVILLGTLTMVEYEFYARLVGEEWLGPSFRGISSPLYALSFILCFLAFDDVSLPFSKQISDIGSKSLGIYLANIPVIYIVAVILYKAFPWTLGNQLVYQTVLVVVGIVIPLLLMNLASKTPVRKVYRYIYG